MINGSPECASEDLGAFARGNMLARSGFVAESLHAAIILHNSKIHDQEPRIFTDGFDF